MSEWYDAKVWSRLDNRSAWHFFENPAPPDEDRDVAASARGSAPTKGLDNSVCGLMRARNPSEVWHEEEPPEGEVVCGHCRRHQALHWDPNRWPTRVSKDPQSTSKGARKKRADKEMIGLLKEIRDQLKEVRTDVRATLSHVQQLEGKIDGGRLHREA